MEDATDHDPPLPTTAPLPVVLRSPWHTAVHTAWTSLNPHPRTCRLSWARIARLSVSLFTNGEQVEHMWRYPHGMPQISLDAVDPPHTCQLAKSGRGHRDSYSDVVKNKCSLICPACD
ncbi:hypothetical protein C8R47DRAFT_1213194 [Mycena vitilis]|nr:hypothetical protein C8R47DRAFT_1213194 [Mycena vitilis]